MKISIAISLLILAAAALIGWRDHNELAGLRAENYRLKDEAAAMGIDVDDPVHGKHRPKREREDKLEKARTTAHDIIGLAKEIERLIESGENPDIATQDRLLKFLENLGALDADQLKEMIECFRDADGLTEKMRSLLFSFPVDALIDRNPLVAIKLLLEEQELPVNESFRSYYISSSLSKWSETDPTRALAWVRANSPDFISRQSMETALVHGAARTDLRLAVGWIGEFGVSDTLGVVTKIAGDLDSPSERSDLLRLMKEQPETFGQKEINGALAIMGKEIGKSGYEEGALWIKENGFSEAEITNLIAGGMVSHSKGVDTGRWVEWMGANLSEGPRERFISSNVTDWTKKDHRAAGEWLAALPDGPAKAPAVAAFAKTVAPYDPEIAAQWALTLPPGNQRDGLIKEVERIRAQKKAAE